MKVLPNVRDEDPAAVPGPPEYPPEPGSAHGGILRLLRQFRTMNAAFRHMQTFLEVRGLTSVAQLDAESRAALIVYLEGIREQLSADRP